MSLKQYFVLICIFLTAYFVFIESVQKFCFDSICFDVMVSDNDIERQKGLSGMERLKKKQGMLFVFDDEKYRSFWMKDMNFPIDIIFMDSEFRVVDIKKNFPPDSYPRSYRSKEIARYVLEINSGKYHIEIGEIGRFIP